jgi:integrase
MKFVFSKTTAVHLCAADWPAPDLPQWISAHQPAEYFGTAGLAAKWAPDTSKCNEIAYGRFLLFLSQNGGLRQVSRVGERVATEDDMRPYFDHLVATVAPLTVKGIVAGISAVVRVTDPTFDRRLLMRAAAYFERRAKPVTDFAKRVVPPAELFKLGMAMMREAETSTHLALVYRAVLYRDGLLIAFLSLIPIRRKNAQSLRDGHHIDVVAGSDRIVIPANEMKVKTKIFDAEMPAVLVERVAVYWRDYRCALARHQGADETALWLTMHGKVMPADTLAERVQRIIWERMGREFSVHNFRHSAATFIADVAPMKALMIAGVLGHAQLRTAMEHYVKGKQRMSFQLYQEGVEELMERHAT